MGSLYLQSSHIRVVETQDTASLASESRASHLCRSLIPRKQTYVVLLKCVGFRPGEACGFVLSEGNSYSCVVGGSSLPWLQLDSLSGLRRHFPYLVGPTTSCFLSSTIPVAKSVP